MKLGWATAGAFVLTHLLMFGLCAAAEAAADVEDDEEYEEYEEYEEGEGPAEGYELVYADAAEVDFPFEMEEEDGELTLESVAAFEVADASEFNFEFSSDLDVPINELVSGKVCGAVRVESSSTAGASGAELSVQ